MSNKLFFNQTFALDDKDADGQLTGKFRGVAYSGQPVGYHSGFQNLITDVSDIEFKPKIPIFLHHDPKLIAGYATIKVDDNKILIEDGQISKSTLSGMEVLNLAKEGFQWEFSIGYSYDWDDLEEIKKDVEVEVNGYKIQGPATIVRKSWLQEVSFVPVGADKQTVAEIFNKQNDIKGNKVKSKIEFDKEAWEKFACGCGGTKDSSLEELAEVMIDEDDLKAMQDENAALKKELEDLKAKMGEMTAKDKEKELTALAEEKGLKLSAEKIKEISLSDEKFETFKEFAGSIEVTKKIDAKFAKPFVVPKTEPAKTDSKEDRTARITQAKELMKLGKAKNLPQALLMVDQSNK